MVDFDLYQNELWGVTTLERKRLHRKIAVEERSYTEYFDSSSPTPPSKQAQQAICERLSKSSVAVTKKFQSRSHLIKHSSSSLIREDILTQPALTDRDKKFWIYVAFRFSRQEQNPLKQVKKLIDNALKSRVPGAKYGLLFDIVTTNSTIITGAPHLLADQIYRYVDATYGDRPGLKFVFVGITDNDNCRTARDVMAKEDISGHPKKPFDAIDNNHLYVVFPFDEELPMKMMIMQQLEEKLQTTTTIQPKTKRAASPLATLNLKNSLLVGSQLPPPPTPMQPNLTLQPRKMRNMVLPRIHNGASSSGETEPGDNNKRSGEGGEEENNSSRNLLNTATTTLLRMVPLKTKTFTPKNTETSSKSSMKSFLPIARPYSASNPFEGSPFMLEKQKHKIRDFHPVPMNSQLAETFRGSEASPSEEDFSFFLTQQLTPSSNKKQVVESEQAEMGESERRSTKSRSNASSTPKQSL